MINNKKQKIRNLAPLALMAWKIFREIGHTLQLLDISQGKTIQMISTNSSILNTRNVESLMSKLQGLIEKYTMEFILD